MSVIGRLRAGHGDEGSAVAFLPILGLLVFAGAAALIGISLQADESTTPPPSINASQLGPTCITASIDPGFKMWDQAALDNVAACIEGRMAAAYGSRDVAASAGFDGVSAGQTFGGEPRSSSGGWAPSRRPSPPGLRATRRVSTPRSR